MPRRLADPPPVCAARGESQPHQQPEMNIMESVPAAPSCCIAARRNPPSQRDAHWKEAINVEPDSTFSTFSSKSLSLFWSVAASVGKASLRLSALTGPAVPLASLQDSLARSLALNAAQVSSGRQGLECLQQVGFHYFQFNASSKETQRKKRLAPLL